LNNMDFSFCLTLTTVYDLWVNFSCYFIL
jgi:hypothetical protein